MDPNSVSDKTEFAVPVPWPDMQSGVREAAISFNPGSILMIKREGTRLLEARWPAICCVCGKPKMHEETTSLGVVYVSAGSIRDKQATVVAQGIPHCADHKEGALFGIVWLYVPQSQLRLGLKFRSYSFQMQFRKLNPWKWVFQESV